MKAIHPHSFTFAQAQFHVLVLLLVVSVAARPIARQLPDPRAILTQIPRNSNDTHAFDAISTVGSKTRTPSKVASEEVMNTFSKDCLPQSTSSSIVSPTTASGIIHTFKLSRPTVASTNTILFSMFTTSMTQVSTSVPVASGTSHPTDIAVISQASTSDSDVSTVSSGSTSPSSVSSTSSTNPFTSGAQSHLSSLPIFLGAFGGIAGVALLIVGIKVYHPTQHLNGIRCWPSALVRRLKQFVLGRFGVEKWRHTGEYDNEKLTERTFPETDPAYEAQNERIS